ncbi:hypothetical protein CVU75_02720 [Candidatus Dependentiae bacterium HGW-Dependentiae-1]|nr:MAG: hypothetical protein CVU75_02720 [Candidatus Dependentiae bacterium HGW-Dependentiae-1]
MIHKKSIVRLVSVVCCISASLSSAMVVFKPHDPLIRPDFRFEKKGELAFFAEHGFKARGFDNAGNRSDVLQIWNCDQNTLAMLKGFPANSPETELLEKVNATDDGTRGHMIFCGDLFMDAGALFGRYHFYREWFLTAYLPFYRMQLKNVHTRDLTQDNTPADIRVKENLTGPISQVTADMGCLNIGPWTRTGFGDATVLLEWVHNFWQPKPFLKNVMLDWRIGLAVPTGKREDEDKLMALPFGYDGNVGLIFGGGIELLLGRYFKVGLDVELIQQFGNTRDRRIRTNRDQTDLLLLQKVCAYRDFGMTQKFDLYLQIFRLWDALSCRVGYQFLKHGDDFLSLRNQDFSFHVANTARPLQEWTVHQGVVTLSYDCAKHLKPDALFKPAVSLFGYLPFNGKRSVAFPLIGGMVSVDF